MQKTTLLTTLTVLAAIVVSTVGAPYTIGIGSGSSMDPTIDDGDIMIISHTYDSVEVGDVIIVDWGDRQAAHRLVSYAHAPKSGEVYVTKGDGHDEEDMLHTPVGSEEGKVVRVIDNPF